MWVMNRFLESRERKKFALLPLSKHFVPSASLSIDTDDLIRMVGEKHPKVKNYINVRDRRRGVEGVERQTNKERDRKDLEERIKNGEEVDPNKKPRQYRKKGSDGREIALAEKDLLWEQFFNIRRFFTKSQVARGECRFTHRIVTDGISVSASHVCPGVKEEKKGRIPKKTSEERTIRR